MPHMPDTLDYASPDPQPSPPPMTLWQELCQGFWLIYYLCWAALGAAGGMVVGHMFGDAFHHQLLVLQGNDFSMAGLAVGAATGGVMAWLARGWRGLHRLCLIAGVVGCSTAICTLGLNLVMSQRTPTDRKVAFAYLGVLLGISLSLAVAGGLAMLLRKTRAAEKNRKPS